jgi:excisionase family DNA binding protein
VWHWINKERALGPTTTANTWGLRYSVAEAARAIGVSRSTAWRWIREGKLRARNPRPGLWLIRRAEVARCLREREEAAAKRSKRLMSQRP